MAKPTMPAKTHVRCGIVDCDWGTPLSSLSASQLNGCRHKFREQMGDDLYHMIHSAVSDALAEQPKKEP
jgi:hypothetical protein